MSVIYYTLISCVTVVEHFKCWIFRFLCIISLWLYQWIICSTQDQEYVKIAFIMLKFYQEHADKNVIFLPKFLESRIDFELERENRVKIKLTLNSSGAKISNKTQTDVSSCSRVKNRTKLTSQKRVELEYFLFSVELSLWFVF